MHLHKNNIILPGLLAHHYFCYFILWSTYRDVYKRQPQLWVRLKNKNRKVQIKRWSMWRFKLLNKKNLIIKIILFLYYFHIWWVHLFQLGITVWTNIMLHEQLTGLHKIIIMIIVIIYIYIYIYIVISVSYTHLDVYKRQRIYCVFKKLN